MATELFSLWGFQTGWRSQRGAGYDVTADLDGVDFSYYALDVEVVDRAFSRACRRTFFRRFLPWLDPPASELGDGRVWGKKDKGDFEPLTDEQYAVLLKAAPAQHGKIVSSLFDPENDHLFTAEAAHKAFAHINPSDKVKFENVCKTVDSAMAEVARKFKQLDAWPENSDEALALIERFARLQHKHSSQYELELTFYCFPVFRKEIEAVLNAEDKLAAASALMSEKLNQWD